MTSVLSCSETNRQTTYLMDEQPTGSLTAHCLNESSPNKSHISAWKWSCLDSIRFRCQLFWQAQLIAYSMWWKKCHCILCGENIRISGFARLFPPSHMLHSLVTPPCLPISSFPLGVQQPLQSSQFHSPVLGLLPSHLHQPPSKSSSAAVHAIHGRASCFTRSCIQLFMLCILFLCYASGSNSCVVL